MYRTSLAEEWKTTRARRRARKKRLRSFLSFFGLLIVLFGAFCLFKLVQIYTKGQNLFAGQAQPAAIPAQSQQVSGQDDAPWALSLVNSQNPVPANYQPELVQLATGQQVDARIYPDLQRMFDDARAEGVYPLVVSGYRTPEQQDSLFNQETTKYTDQGYSGKEAVEMAKLWVAQPGYSEHQLGLSVDINADKTLSSNEIVYQWLCENSYKYGFVLRYPENKTDITGILYEPWHFRYVGSEAAYEMFTSGLCLEEYLEGQAF